MLCVIRKSERSRRHSDTSVSAQGPQDGQHLPDQGGGGEGGGLRHLQDAQLCQQGRPDRAGYTLLHQPRDGVYPQLQARHLCIELCCVCLSRHHFAFTVKAELRL